ncbi:hypothetical protein Pelo_17244 [Pelomyxa schiedti]|nr:hypothetical protein Pelo_17244 [Pelomyxa schiedti]
MNPDATPFVPRTRTTAYAQCCLCSRTRPKQVFVGPFSPCLHSFCRECLYKHIGQQLTRRLGAPMDPSREFVVCPVRGCNTALPMNDFRPMVVSTTSIPSVVVRRPTSPPQFSLPAYNQPSSAQIISKQPLPYDPLFHQRTYVDIGNMNEAHSVSQPSPPVSIQRHTPTAPKPLPQHGVGPQRSASPKYIKDSHPPTGPSAFSDEQQYISSLPEDFWSSPDFMVSSVSSDRDEPWRAQQGEESWQGVGKGGSVIKAPLS